MIIKQIHENKKQFLELLLLADEQESMIDKYLERGEMFALYEGGLRAVCVVTDEGNGICELKNMVTVPESQRKGYGKRLVEFISVHYSLRYLTMLVGTGDSPLTIPFYLKCGFAESYRVKNFFTDHYDHPIYEAGRQLRDMVYLAKAL